MLAMSFIDVYGVRTLSVQFCNSVITVFLLSFLITTNAKQTPLITILAKKG